MFMLDWLLDRAGVVLPREFKGASSESQGVPRQSPESLKRAQESSKETKGA